VPSKQVKEKILPMTNLRASVAFISPATAGAINTPMVKAPNIKRASMLNSTQLSAGQITTTRYLYPLLTILTVATMEQLGW
jgi:hypothetical protein